MVGNRVSFNPPRPRPPAYPCLSDGDDDDDGDANRDGPAKLNPRPSRKRHY